MFQVRNIKMIFFFKSLIIYYYYILFLKKLKYLLITDHPMRDLRKIRPLPRSASDNTIYNGKARTKLHRNRTHTVHSGIPGKSTEDQIICIIYSLIIAII